MRILYKRKQRTTCLAFSRTDERLAVGARLSPKQGRVDVWNALAEVKPITLPSLPAPAWQMAFTADGRLAVAQAYSVMLYSGPRFQSVEVVAQWDWREYLKASLSPDGKLLVLDTQDMFRLIALRQPLVELWNRPPPDNRDTPGGVAFSPDNGQLAVGGKRSVEIWTADTGSPVAIFETPPVPERWFGFKLLWSPDGRWVCEQWQQWVNLWDATTGKLVFQRVAQHNEWINDAAFHWPSGRLAIAIAGQEDGVVRIYAPDAWQEERAYQWPVGRIQALAFHANGMLAAVGGDKPDVVVWDVDW